MLPKPTACQGCPAYGNGKGFVPDELVAGSPVWLLGCGVTRDEELTGQPLAGRAGAWVERDFFPLAGLTRHQNVSIGNLLKCRWTDTNTGKKTDALPIPTVLRDTIAHCTAAHLRIPAGVNLIVAHGEEAWAYASNGVGPLLGKGEDDESGKWRGYLAPEPRLGIPSLGVLGVHEVLKKRRYLVPSQWDWQKIRSILKGTWPLPVPPCPTEQDWASAESWLTHAQTAEYVVIDTEFDRDTKSLFLMGLGAKHGEAFTGLQFQWIHGIAKRTAFTAALRNIIRRVPIVFHNAMADLPVIEQATGIAYREYRQVEDTMLAQAVLYSEWPHDLEFCDSLCGKHTKLKHLSDTNALLYNWGDVLSTQYVHEWNLREFQRDPASERIYREQSLRLYAPRLEALADGIAVNQPRVQELLTLYGARKIAAQRIAQAYVGYPINVGSDKQLKYWLYQRGALAVQKNKQTKQASIGKDAIAVLRRQFYDFDPDDEKDGLTPEQVQRNIAQGAHPLLEARALYAGASQMMSHYLHPLLDGGG